MVPTVIRTVGHNEAVSDGHIIQVSQVEGGDIVNGDAALGIKETGTGHTADTAGTGEVDTLGSRNGVDGAFSIESDVSTGHSHLAAEFSVLKDDGQSFVGKGQIFGIFGIADGELGKSADLAFGICNIVD